MVIIQLFIVIVIILIIYQLIIFTRIQVINKKLFQKIPLSSRLTKKNIENLNKGQKIMTNLLREFDRICRKYKLKYWCAGGTLIGVLRHLGWVPWDGDIDVAMEETDYLKFEKIVQKELPKNMWFQNTKIDNTHRISHLAKIRDLNSCYIDLPYVGDTSHNGLQLDLFIFKKEGDMLISPNKEVFKKKTGDIKDIPYSIIFPVKEDYFEDIKVYIPNNYQEYCHRYWDNHYPPNLPLKEKRYPHEGNMDPDKTCQHHYKIYPNLYPGMTDINYRGKMIKFPLDRELKENNNQVWVNFTGLTTKRPEYIYDYIRNSINLYPNIKILDIGCGCAELGIELDRDLGNTINYTGVDIIDDLLAVNRINLPHYKFINIKDNQSFYNQKFDIVCYMGYGHSMDDSIKNTVGKIKPKYIILESHIGKKPDFDRYDKIIKTNYNPILSENIYCGESDNYIRALDRHICIYIISYLNY